MVDSEQIRIRSGLYVIVELSFLLSTRLASIMDAPADLFPNLYIHVGSPVSDVT